MREWGEGVVYEVSAVGSEGNLTVFIPPNLLWPTIPGERYGNV